MPKRTIGDLPIDNRRLLIRADLNAPLNADGTIAGDRRIRAVLPTLQYALHRGASVVLMTHLGRPEGQRRAELSLDRVAERLDQLLGETKMRKCNEVVGAEAKVMVESLLSGELLLLENLRFHPGETSGDEAFARQLRRLGETYINDAFATCHRKHASVYALPQQFSREDRAIGFLVAKELRILDELLGSPKRPLVVVLGGAKVSDKIGVVETLIDRADRLLIGGALAYPFLQANGQGVGSPIDPDAVNASQRLLDRAGEKLLLPVDHIVMPEEGASDAVQVVDGAIPDGWRGMDIGPKTIQRFEAAIGQAATVLWNGPLGKFEEPVYRDGTAAIARAMAGGDAVSILGGGETAEAVERIGLADRMTHISTGGGAFLKYLEHRSLPALDLIDEL